jgi:hypothetical protein
MPSWLYLFAGAELFFLLTRAPDFIALAKADHQRTARETQRIRRGSLRSITLEMLIFVPASATLLLLILPLVLRGRILPAAAYAALGTASYGFPFAALRTIVTRSALNTLKEFAAIVPQEARDDEQ